MKKILSTFGGLLLLAAVTEAQTNGFRPGHLAVLRAGDGVFDLKLKQSPIFVDQFDPQVFNVAPSFSLPIPTNGPNSFFFNGHAGSEGNLNRSANHKLLTFAGYGGVDLLQVKGTASRLDIQRGFCALDAAGTIHTYYYKAGMADAKMNPRGVVTDGTNNFWGCGNTLGTLYFNPLARSGPVRFVALPNSRDVKIINHVLYVSINAADADVLNKPSGIYDFLPEAFPRQTNSVPRLFIPAESDYKKIVGFDINPAKNTAYMTDIAGGIQKYVRTQEKWALAYNFAIPQSIPRHLNTAAGCFGLKVDFTGAAPVIYATTTEGYGGSVNSNRVVRIVDTNSTAVVTTVAQAVSTNIAFRGVEFTPEQ